MSQYVRVKRLKQTIFLNCEPTDTVMDVKTKLQQFAGKGPDDIRLLADNNPLDETKTLADLKVENDAVVCMVFMKEDGNEKTDPFC